MSDIEVSNDDDAAGTITNVAMFVDDAGVQIEEHDYQEAIELLDEYIEKLQAVKTYCESKVAEGVSTQAPLAVKQNQETSGDKVLHRRAATDPKESGARGRVGARPSTPSSRRR